MTEHGDDAEHVDPRYDPAFQRGFAGGVDRLRGDERAYARPGGTTPGAATAGAAPAGAAPARRASSSPVASALTGPRRPGPSVPSAPAEAVPLRLPSGGDAAAEPFPEPEEPPRAVDAAPREAPLLRNPWLIALLLAGLAGSALGLVALYAGYSSPPASYYGDSDTPSPAWIQRQILYYASIPLLGCLPFSLLLALAIAALRWRGSPRRVDDAAPEGAVEARAIPEARATTEARRAPEAPQTPEAPKSRPSR